MRSKFSFLYVDIWFNVTKCNFIVKNSSFELLVAFWPIFVAETIHHSMHSFFGTNMHKGLIFFIIFVANEIFTLSFAKRDFIRYYYFINIYILYRNRSFMMVKFLFLDLNIIKFYNCFFHFYIRFQKFSYIVLIYNFPLIL